MRNLRGDLQFDADGSMSVSDIVPMLELLLPAARSGWRVHEVDVAYAPRVTGTSSKVSGSVSGTVRTIADFARVLI